MYRGCSDRAPGGPVEVVGPQRRNAGQLVAYDVAGVFFEKEINMRVTHSAGCDLLHNGFQAVFHALRPDDAARGVVGASEFEQRGRIQRLLKRLRRRHVEPGVEFIEEYRQKPVGAVAFGDEEPVEIARLLQYRAPSGSGGRSSRPGRGNCGMPCPRWYRR